MPNNAWQIVEVMPGLVDHAMPVLADLHILVLEVVLMQALVARATQALEVAHTLVRAEALMPDPVGMHTLVRVEVLMRGQVGHVIRAQAGLVMPDLVGGLTRGQVGAVDVLAFVNRRLRNRRPWRMGFFV